MSWRNRPLPEYVSITQMWPRGTGKYWKRRLSKARRRYAKDLIKLGKGREPTTIESNVNFKLW